MISLPKYEQFVTASLHKQGYSPVLSPEECDSVDIWYNAQISANGCATMIGTNRTMDCEFNND